MSSDRKGRWINKVLRGGAYNNNEDNLHAAYRNTNHPHERNKNIGGVVVWRSQHSLNKEHELQAGVPIFKETGRASEGVQIRLPGLPSLQGGPKNAVPRRPLVASMR